MATDAMSSTTCRQEIECSYRNSTNSTRNISGKCQVDYGVVGVAGPGFRRVKWSDGVITQISIPRVTVPGKANRVEVDGLAAEAVGSCGFEVYRIGNNTLELRGDLCR